MQLPRPGKLQPLDSIRFDLKNYERFFFLTERRKWRKEIEWLFKIYIGKMGGEIEASKLVCLWAALRCSRFRRFNWSHYHRGELPRVNIVSIAISLYMLRTNRKWTRQNLRVITSIHRIFEIMNLRYSPSVWRNILQASSDSLIQCFVGLEGVDDGSFGGPTWTTLTSGMHVSERIVGSVRDSTSAL